MSQRYFVESPITSAQARLTSSEAHHLLHVMRAKVGDQVVLFDGSGAEFTATIAQLLRSEIVLDVLARQEADRELPVDLTIGVALPKGDRQQWLVEKSVELGVTRLVPLTTERAVAQPIEKALDRLRRAAAEAAKQCGRNRLLEIAPPETWPEFLARADASNALAAVAHPYDGIPAQQFYSAVQAAERRPVLLAVGPEGGFSDEEIALVGPTWLRVRLGARILRIETAVACLAAIVAAAVE